MFKSLCTNGGGGVGFATYGNGWIHCCDGKKYCGYSQCNPPKEDKCKKQTKECECEPTEKNWCPLTEDEPKCTQKNTKKCSETVTLSWCPEEDEPDCPPTGGEGGN